MLRLANFFARAALALGLVEPDPLGRRSSSLYRTLMALDDDMLADIGIARGDIEVWGAGETDVLYQYGRPIVPAPVPVAGLPGPLPLKYRLA